MNRRKRKGFIASGVLLLSFVLWTFLIQTVDVQPVGVNGTSVGFAAVNTWFHRLTGVHISVSGHQAKGNIAFIRIPGGQE